MQSINLTISDANALKISLFVCRIVKFSIVLCLTAIPGWVHAQADVVESQPGDAGADEPNESVAPPESPGVTEGEATFDGPCEFECIAEAICDEKRGTMHDYLECSDGLICCEYEEYEPIVIPPLDWLITIAPVAMYLKNKTTFKFDVPTEVEGIYDTEKLTVKDNAWGAGLTMVGFYKWISLAKIFWYMPSINKAWNVGGVLFLTGSIPTGTFVKPTIGMGFFYNIVDTHWTHFSHWRESATDNGVSTIGGSDFNTIDVNVKSFAPIPTLGLTFKIPLYNWWVRPYYSFWYTRTIARAQSSGGRVDVWRDSDVAKDTQGVDDSYIVIGGANDPEELVFDETKITESYANVVGAWFNLDFNYFIQLLGQYTVNVDKNLHSLRLIFTLMFSEFVGATVVFDYQQYTTVKNTAVYFGPCFLIMQPGFYDAVMKKRDAAMEGRE